MDVHVVGLALWALVCDLDDDGAICGIRVAAARLVAQLQDDIMVGSQMAPYWPSKYPLSSTLHLVLMVVGGTSFARGNSLNLMTSYNLVNVEYPTSVVKASS